MNSAKAITTYMSGALVDDLTIEKVETVVTDFEQFCVDLSKQWQIGYYVLKSQSEKIFCTNVVIATWRSR